VRMDHCRRLRIVVLLLIANATAAAAGQTLVDHARRGDERAVRLLVAKHQDVNTPEADGTSPLHWAVHHDDLAMVDLLIRAGADVNASNRYGVTPVQLASLNGNAAILDRLLSKGASARATLPDGETALMTAARSGDAGTVRLLLARGADVNAKERSREQTALMWAAAENNAEVVALLLEAGAGMNPAPRPTASSDVEAPRIGQITQAAAVSFEGAFTPYLFAVRAGHIDTVKVLLEAGVKVDESLPDGTPALTLAILNGHYELASILLDKGANPNGGTQGWSALHQVVWTRRPNTGFNLPGAQPTGRVSSLELARDLIRRGADVNARQLREPRDGNRHMASRLGATPFLLAAKSADLALMLLLLQHGADPTTPTTEGMTPLMAASGVGVWAPGESPGSDQESLEAVSLVLEATGGKGVNDVDQSGYTALHGAIHRGGHLPLVRLLVERGALLDVRTSKGWTPLRIADGVEYTPTIFKRYPETAAYLRKAMTARGLAVPPPPSEQLTVGLDGSTAGGNR
jgi:ankyrin repeat protein